MKLKALSFAVIAVTAFVTPAVPQTYRFLDYDMRQVIEIKGTVQELNWMNPNSELHVLVKNGATGRKKIVSHDVV